MMHRTVFCPLIVTFMLVYLFDVVMISAILCSLSLFFLFFSSAFNRHEIIVRCITQVHCFDLLDWLFCYKYNTR